MTNITPELAQALKRLEDAKAKWLEARKPYNEAVEELDRAAKAVNRLKSPPRLDLPLRG